MSEKINGGIIFKNDRKTADSQPDYKGTINHDGKEMDIALWVKEGKKGKFFSVKLSEPYKKKYAEPEPEPIEGGDNLPF